MFVLLKIIRFLPVRFHCKLQALMAGGRLTLGKGSYIHGSVHMLGKNNIQIGSNTCISEGCWLNVNHRVGSEPAIKIGNNCFIGKNNFFSSGLRISFGDYVLTTIGCKFIGSSHDINDPLKPYISTGTTNSDVIEIGVNSFLGANAIVLGNVKVGHGSVIGAGAQVMHDIPPFSIAIGNPAKVIKRFSFLKNAWMPIDELTKEDINAMPEESLYLKKISGEFLKVPLPFTAAGRNMGNL